MRADTMRDVEKLYNQTLEFLEDDPSTAEAVPGPSRIDYQNNFRTVPEKYLLKDNLLLLLKDV